MKCVNMIIQFWAICYGILLLVSLSLRCEYFRWCVIIPFRHMHGIHLEGLKANKNVNMENRNAVTIFIGEQKVSVAKIHISTVPNGIKSTTHITYTHSACVCAYAIQQQSLVWFDICSDKAPARSLFSWIHSILVDRTFIMYILSFFHFLYCQHTRHAFVWLFTRLSNNTFQLFPHMCMAFFVEGKYDCR